jgi:hypothetical protein
VPVAACGDGYLYGVVRTWMSPQIPTIASLLLAALWGLSVFAGWGLEAFCADPDPGSDCAARLDAFSAVSAAFAVIAAVCTIGGWFLQRAVLLGIAVGAWVAAVGVLFVGGIVAQ